MSALNTLLRSFAPRRNRRPDPYLAPWQRGAVTPGFATDKRAPLTAHTMSIDDFRRAPVWHDRIDHLHHAFEQAPQIGHILELGVHKAGSLNWLARWSAGRDDKTVYGFDSFAGLPEAWVRTKDGQRYAAGHFALPGLPPVEPNAQLVPGFFEATLPRWLAEHSGPVALLHNDSDLYSSTRDTLRLLNGRLVPGTIIVFDELCDWTESGVYDNWDQGEWRALGEWMSQFHRKIAAISRDGRYAAAARVVE
jgi:hypothetical protein